MFCEDHLEKLDPRSLALRKEKPVSTAACLPNDEWSHIADELKACNISRFFVLNNPVHCCLGYKVIFQINTFFFTDMARRNQSVRDFTETAVNV